MNKWLTKVHFANEGIDTWTRVTNNIKKNSVSTIYISIYNINQIVVREHAYNY